MVRRRVHRTKRSATTGRPTRYQLWVDLGAGKKGARRRGNPLSKAFTKITTWLRAVDGTTRRRATTRRKGWSTGDVHPNLYRRHATAPKRSSVDEVARMRQRRKNRGAR